MTFETSNWKPDEPLPTNVDRKTAAKVVTHFVFPVSPRTIASWPLVVKRPNRSAIYNTQELIEYAEKKLANSISYKQSEDW